jgi:Tfp pilus assembly protein PilO
MAKMSEKQRLLAIGGTALGACVIACGGVFWAKGLIEEMQQTIAQKRTEIAAAEQKIAKIPASEKEVIILRENLGEYVKILPEDQGLNDFVKVLQQFEQSSGIQTVEFKPGRPNRNPKNPERFERIEYQYGMTATLWQFLKFINSIENYERFVSITDFSIQQVNSRDIEVREGEVVHSIQLTMETYTYNPAGSGQDVTIPDYDDKREMLREEIFKRMQAIRIDKYEHRGSRGRRDIFVDPREREGRADGPPIEEQRAILDRYLGELQRLRAVVAKLRKPDLTIFDQFTLDRELKEGIGKLEDAVAEVNQKQQISAPQLRLRWVKEVVEPLADMKSTGGTKDPRTEQDPYLSADEMQQLVDSMSQLLNEGDLAAADERFDVISPRLLVPETDPRYPLAVTAKALHVRVKTAIEFSSLDIRIQGVLVNHDGGRSGLLMNGEVYEEGDYISDELMLRRVEEEQVWFVFRGLTLIRTL